jgi:Tol biopolymer transport system component
MPPRGVWWDVRKALLIIVLAAVAGIAAAAPASATYPGGNGLISWSTSRGYEDGSSAVWGMRAFGDEPRHLTFHKDSAQDTGSEYRSDTDASWAADGRSFAFSRAFGIGPRLFVKTLGEPRARKIPLGKMEAENPTFAPDGRRVAFVKIGPSDGVLGRGPLSVMVARVDGTGVRRFGGGDNPTWTPDGRRIVYENSRGGRIRLISVRPDGTHKHVFPKRCAGVGGVSFAPDGSAMAAVYSREQGGPVRIWTMGLGCRHKRQVTFHRPAVSAAWSPDGQSIAYWAPSNAHHQSGLFVVRPDGTGNQLVRENDGGFDLDWQPRP